MCANLEKFIEVSSGVLMPTLFRLLVAIAFIAGLGYAGMFALSVLVQPQEREVSVRVPTRDFLQDASR